MELKPEALTATLNNWNNDHFLTPALVTALKEALATADRGVA
jgi:hypothetical protein